MVQLNVKIYVEKKREMTAEDGDNPETLGPSYDADFTHLLQNISTGVVFLIRMWMLSLPLNYPQTNRLFVTV